MSVSRAKQGSLNQTLALHMQRNFLRSKEKIWLVWRVISLLILFYFLPSENEEQKTFTIYNVNITEGMSLSAYHWHETCRPGSWEGYFVSKGNNEVLKSTHLRVVDALELCSYKLWFNRLQSEPLKFKMTETYKILLLCI